MIHICHAHACERRVPPEMLMCLDHWFRIPRELRNRLHKAFCYGQTTDKRPSAEYMTLAHQAISHVARREGRSKAAEYHRLQAEKFANWVARDVPPPIPEGEEVSGA